MNLLENVISRTSEIIWPIFLPILFLLSIYIGYKIIFKVQYQITDKQSISFKNMIGPMSISLGTMIGTGAIIGVLGSLANLYLSTQIHIEALAFWAVIGGLILIPLSYVETIVAKVMNKPTQKYLEILLGKTASKIYAISFIVLHIFGFGGFQFSGINTSISIISQRYFDISLIEIQRYLFIVIPIIIIIAIIILSKKHHIFINAMTYMIGTAVFLYFIFFFMFLFKTSDYITIFLSNMFEGIKNPSNAIIGVPTGLILGSQRVIQTAETGLGALGMSSLEADSKPREAAIITLIPTVITIFVAIFVTSYITSYGIYNGFFTIDATVDSFVRLESFFITATVVTGKFGLYVLILFTILSGLTTLLGSYFFLDSLLDISENSKIIIYFVLTITAGTLAVFGFDIIFEVVDLLLFVVLSLNVIGLFKFSISYYKNYIKK